MSSPFRWIRKHLRLFFLLVVFTGLAGGILIWRYGGGYAQSVIRKKLQVIVSGHLNANLEMGDITYKYPFGVEVEDVSLITTSSEEPGVTLASFKKMHLQLAKSPLTEGPLVIERIELEQPTLHLIREQSGFIGSKHLLRLPEEKPSLEAKIEKIPQLSEVFHLRHMQLAAMKVIYEDRRLSKPVPLQWENLDMTVDSQPLDETRHQYSFTGHAGKLAEISSRGELDLDQLFLKVTELDLQASLTKDQTTSPLPPAIQEILSKMHVSGSADLKLSGDVPLRSLEKVALTGQLFLRNGTAVIPGTNHELNDLDFDLSCNLSGSKASATLTELQAQAGIYHATIKSLTLAADLDSHEWKVSPLTVSLISKPLTSPPDSLENQPFTLDLVVQLDQYEDRHSYKVLFDGTKLRFDAADQDLAIFGVLRVDDSTATIQSFRIEGLGGTMRFQGAFHLDQTFSTEAQISDIDLTSLRSILAPQKKSDHHGRVSGRLRLEMPSDAVADLRGNGYLQLRDGQFGHVPVLTGIAKTIGLGQNLFIAESASARFDIASEKIQISRLSATTKTFKLAGKGTIGFDESLDLSVYAGSAGDWGKGIRDTNIPIISDIGGMLGSGTQGIVNGISSQISSMKVTGTLKDPKVTPDPAPVLTDPIKNLFKSDGE